MANTVDHWGDAGVGAPWTEYLRPAPGDLRIVQAFVNTARIGPGADELENPQALADYLARWGLLPVDTDLGDTDQRRAVEVREGLRSLLREKTGTALDREAMGHLDRAVTGTMLRVRFDGRGTIRLAPAGGGFDGALGRLVGIVAQADFAGLLPRLKACAGETCGLAFYDFSRNRTGRWCSMERCGNKIKVRAWRRRNPRRSKEELKAFLRRNQ